MTVGQYITDGTAVFILRDTRDGTPIGRPITDDILRDSYVKRNGALLQRSDYPTLVKFLQDNPSLVTTEAAWAANKNLYTWGSGTSTSGANFRVPDDRGLYEQLSDSLGLVAAGLPNATGEFGQHSSCSATGVFARTTSAYEAISVAASSNNGISLDLSKANNIFGRSNTVTPPTVKRIVQMKY